MSTLRLEIRRVSRYLGSPPWDLSCSIHFLDGQFTEHKQTSANYLHHHLSWLASIAASKDEGHAKIMADCKLKNYGRCRCWHYLTHLLNVLLTSLGQCLMELLLTRLVVPEKKSYITSLFSGSTTGQDCEMLSSVSNRLPSTALKTIAPKVFIIEITKRIMKILTTVLLCTFRYPGILQVFTLHKALLDQQLRILVIPARPYSYRSSFQLWNNPQKTSAEAGSLQGTAGKAPKRSKVEKRMMLNIP